MKYVIVLAMCTTLLQGCFAVEFNANGTYTRPSCHELRQNKRILGGVVKGATIGGASLLAVQSQTLNPTNAKEKRNAETVNTLAIGAAVGSAIGVYVLDDMNDEYRDNCSYMERRSG
jgi:hypothetical protein